jgi:hypothetical protein
MQRAVRANAHLPERRVGGEHRVVVARQHDLHRRLGTNGDLQRLGQGPVDQAAIGVHLSGRLQRMADDGARQHAEGGFKRRGYGPQTRQIVTAGVDFGPGDRTGDQSARAIREIRQQIALLGRQGGRRGHRYVSIRA